MDRFEHEGDPAAFVHTYTEKDYDSDGNVIAYIDAAGPGPDDDLHAEIRYTGRLAACRARHIVGTADRIVIRNGAGEVMRRRDADIQCEDGTMREIRVHQGSGEIAHTRLFYDENGNLTGVIGPRNHRGQRMHHAYTYDSDVHTYVVRIDDSHGDVSTAAYDMRFGAVTRDTDINGVGVTTDYDAFGRPWRITGPYERDAGLPYTIEFAYVPAADVPYATTAHMDRFRDVADPIETVTFIDGLGRTLQTKKDATVHRGDDAPAQDVAIERLRTASAGASVCVCVIQTHLHRRRSHRLQAVTGHGPRPARRRRPLSQMLDTWWEHHAQNGHDHAGNTGAPPHDQVPSQMPDSGQPDENFISTTAPRWPEWAKPMVTGKLETSRPPSRWLARMLETSRPPSRWLARMLETSRPPSRWVTGMLETSRPPSQ